MRFKILCLIAIMGAGALWAQAPTSITYPHSTSITYHQSVSIVPDTPLVTGGAAASYSVSPSLPAGLSVHSTKGILSGTPSALKAAANYTVTASNLSGTVQTVLNIAVIPPAPTGFSYPYPNSVYARNIPIAAQTPNVLSGQVTSFSVSPALPGGLSLDGATGMISGTPLYSSPASTYVVTVTGPGGTALDTLVFTVADSLSWNRLLVNGGCAVSAPSSDTAYAFSSNYFGYRTIDRGQSWDLQPIPSGPGGFTYRASYFLNARVGFLVGNNLPNDTKSVLSKTTDAGATWSQTLIGTTDKDTVFAVQFMDTNTGYYSSQFRVGKTLDGGASWIPIAGTARIYGLHFRGATGFAVGDSGKILKTTNAGVDWTRQLTGSLKPLLAVHFPSADTGYAVGDSGRILKTTNAGATWLALSSGTSTRFKAVKFRDGFTGYAVGDTVLKTTDGGVTWAQEAAGQLSGCGIDFLPSGTTFIGGKAGLFGSGVKYLPFPDSLVPVDGAVGVSRIPILSWKAPPGATSFRVQMHSDAPVFDTVVTTSSLAAGPLVPGTQHFWRVRAKGPGGWSLFTQYHMFTPSATSPRPPLTLIAPRQDSLNAPLNVQLIWKASIAATGYRVQLSADSLFASTVIDTTIADTVRAVGPLSLGTRYFWRAKSFGLYGDFDTSAYVMRAFTTVAPPPAPVLSKPVADSSGAPASLTLTWNAAAGATAYRVQLATDTSFASPLVNDSLTALARAVGPLPLGASYYWRVRAFNAYGAGPYSTARRFTVSPPSAIIPRLAWITSMSGSRNVLRYTLSQRMRVRARLYDVNGGLVATLIDGPREAGAHSQVLSPDKFPGGYVLLEFRAGAHRQTLRLAP